MKRVHAQFFWIWIWLEREETVIQLILTYNEIVWFSYMLGWYTRKLEAAQVS